MTVTYTSSKTRVATVDSTTGAVTIVGKGTTTITASFDGDEEFKAGKAEYTLTVVDPNPKPYVLLTDINDLTDGAEALIVCTEKGVAMADQADGYRMQESVSIVDGQIENPSEKIALVTINKVGDKYTFYVNNVTEGYLYNATDKKLNTHDEATAATVSIASSGDAKINFISTSYLQYNFSAKRFACYAGTQADIQLYVQDDGRTPAGLSFAQASYEGGKVAGFEAPKLINPNNLTVVYTSSDENVAKVAADGAVDVKGLGTTIITAAFVGNDTFKAGKAAYTLTVNDDREVAALSYPAASKTIDQDDEVTDFAVVNEGNLQLTFKSSEPSVAEVAEDGTVTVKNHGETTITAEFKGNDAIKPAKAEYTLTVNASANTLAKFIERGLAETSVEFKMACELTVTAIRSYNSDKNRYIYVTDNESNVLIFINKAGSQNYNDNDIIPAGWTGKMSNYNGLYEIVEPKGMTAATNKGDFVPAVMNYSVATDADVNKVIELVNVEFTAATPSTDGTFTGVQNGTVVTFNNKVRLASTDVAGEFNVIAAVYIQNGVRSVVPLSYLPLDEPAALHSITANGQTVTGNQYELQYLDDVYVSFENIDEGIEVHHSFTLRDQEETPEAAPGMMRAPKEGFTVYTAPVRVDAPGTFTYYTEDVATGRRSAVNDITFGGIHTGIENVTVEGAADAIYFNLQGERIAHPEAGLYIRVAGGKAEKIMLR
ncbi:MAG: hypothetical protein NC418_03895 [Muribaculaceae bacterium]|nr:hypothetical protein [Muribaculaceae bacterium]